MEQPFEYFAFISYKREDEKWAKWLQRKLETYKSPTVIATEKPELPRRLKPVFKDTTDIKPGVLAEVLAQNLAKSKYLIVVCSPRSAHSQWVGKEISDFIALDKSDNIILFIVEGISYSNDPETECYHPAIKEKLPEMLGVNVNEAGKEWKYIKKQKAFIRVVSFLLNVSFDSLWQRQKRRIIRNWRLGVLGTLLFVSALSGVSLYQYRVNQPFDIRISLKEITVHNPHLPFQDGIVKLCYDKDTLVSKPISGLKGFINFRNIPGSYLGKPAHLQFIMFGFYQLDTIVELQYTVIVPIQRDSAYCKVQGYVRDRDSDIFLPGIIVEIEGYQTGTNNKGFFLIEIPLQQQKTSYQAILRQNGHVVAGQTVYPTKNEPTLNNTIYFK